jgi:hypothetical protein
LGLPQTRDEAAQATADASKAKAQVKVLQELVANLEEAMAVSESTVEELVKHGTEFEEAADARAVELTATLAKREKELEVLKTSERAAKADRDAAKEELKVAKRQVEETTVTMAEELESVLEAHAALEAQRAHSNKMVETLQKEAQAAALTAASAQCDVVQARNAVLASAAAMEKHMQALKDITEGATTKKKKGFGKKNNGESVEFKDPAGMLRQTVSTADALALEMEALVKQVEQKTSHIEDPRSGHTPIPPYATTISACFTCITSCITSLHRIHHKCDMLSERAALDLSHSTHAALAAMLARIEHVGCRWTLRCTFISP